jgi:two-component sensor histidine kinase
MFTFTRLLIKTKHISLLFCCLFGTFNVVFSQQENAKNNSFKQKIEVIQLLTNTQQYSQAIRELKALENSKSIKKSKENEVDYRLMKARVYRLSSEFDAAMREVDKIPDLRKYKKLKIKVDFVRAALYMENPKYSMEQRIKIVYPIIDAGIKTAKELKSELDLAAFYNLKAGLHSDECNIDHRNCNQNYSTAIIYYKKAMKLFLQNNDTLNFHNCLSGLFVISISMRTADLDTLRDLMLEYANRINYFPNVFASRHRLASYYLLIKKDSSNYLKQTILAKNAMIDMVNKNADNAVGQLKLRYEFDSLKSNINHSKELVSKRDIVIKEKNKRIQHTIIFSISLVVLLILVVYFLIDQRKLTKKVNVTNLELKHSNHNYELLVRESNHRIKNNLQMITSMLELDKANVNKEGLDILTNISAKISTITALHRILNFKEHNQKVLLKIYFNEIINYYNNLTQNANIINADFTNIEVQSERIIYFGLILNEMLSNTIKHRKVKDEIIIQVLKTDNSFVFIYRDNSNYNSFTKNNGIQLIEGLIVRLDGIKLAFNPTLGEYKFYFNE